MRDSDWSWLVLLRYHAERRPDRTAVIYEGVPTTYGDLIGASRALAGGLHGLGVGWGDTVALLMQNSLELLQLMVASAWLGAIPVPINWRMSAEEVAHLLRSSSAGVLVSDPEFYEVARSAESMLDAPVQRVATGTTRGGDWVPLNGLFDTSFDQAPALTRPGDPHRLIYTSGTTSHPKGAILTHRNIFFKNVALNLELNLNADTVALVCGPMYHVGALEMAGTPALHAGGTMVIHRRFDPAAVARSIHETGVTHTWLAPTMIRELLATDEVSTLDMSSLESILTGGEKMPEHLIRRTWDTFPSVRIVDAYGLTEAAGGVTLMPASHQLEKLGSVGKPILFYSVKLEDPAAPERPVPAGDSGEILVRGPQVFTGYWNDDDATGRALDGGWLHTGDIGRMDEDGFLYMVDRLKDMIISGGENIASQEVERVLLEHPAIEEAVVIGRPDDQWGEVPIAFVIASGPVPTEGDVIEYCRGRLAHYKAPKQVIFRDELPRNPTGKILKRELRKELAEG